MTKARKYVILAKYTKKLFDRKADRGFIMAYEIIVLDLDGTLTNSKKEISPKTKEALLKIQQDGKKVVLASGRPTPGILNLAEELKLKEYGGFILSFNGAKITNAKTNEIILNETIPQEFIRDIYLSSLEYGIGILTYTDTQIIAGNGIDEYAKLESQINHLPIMRVDDMLDFIQFPVNKFLMTGKPEVMLEVQTNLRKKFGTKLNIFRSEPFFLEIMPPEIDKAASLDKLLKILNKDKEQMICCGDGFNDASMIAFAGLGVAMKNAQEEVKKLADYITYSNDEDGIAHVIEKFMINNKGIAWQH